MRKGDTLIRKPISRWRPLIRQLTTVAAAGLMAVACGSDGPKDGEVGHVESNFGGVVSDEPKSALIGRDVLSAGGNAVDAIVATYFAMSVTNPGAATLGGGGLCVVHRGVEGSVEAIDFRPAKFTSGNATAMIPGAVRGMFALHARYGRLKWEGLLLPAERMARFGHPVPRAFARQIAGMSADKFGDPELRRIFFPAGKPVGEGHVLRQETLSSTLAGIRLRGPGEFYAGDFAKALAADLGRMAGIDIPVEAFRSYQPKWQKTTIVDVGKDQLHLPAGEAGIAAAAAWAALIAGRPLDAGQDAMVRDGASAGFIAVDSAGGGAACVVSANGALGAARIIGSSGILAAAPPRDARFPGLPMLLINKPQRDARGAVTGAGGAAGIARGIAAAFRAFRSDVPLDRAFGAAPKIATGRANLIRCPKGAREELELCRFVTDPAGHGLAVSAAF